jgi:magnesium transporter
MTDQMLNEQVEHLIKEKQLKKLKALLSELKAPDIVDLWENIPDEHVIILFRLLGKDLAADVFSELSPERQEAVIKDMSNNQIKEIILEIPPDDRTEIFEDLPGEVTQKLLNILPTGESREALDLLGYPEESVGRLMTPDYIALQPSWTIRQALAHIRKFGKDAETINIIYVVDERWHLLDAIALRRIILAKPDELVESLMDRQYFAINVYEDQEEAVKIMNRYDLVALPVTDTDGTLIGIVTIDDILDVLEEETTEDFQRTAAIAPLDINYSSAPFYRLYFKRIGWLSILLITGFISPIIISGFETTLEQVIALAFFIPLLIDSGGNTSTQSSTLVIRAIAVGDITAKKWFRVVKKELVIGLLLGSSLGVLLFLRALLFRESPILLGLTLGTTTLSIIMLANILGALLPLVLTKFKLDPAVISSPLITTVMDSLGLLIYFLIANLIFRL